MENKEKEYLLIVHHESGDEIHFNVIDYSLYPKIDELIKDIIKKRTFKNVEEMKTIIYDNLLDDLMCQTYVLEDYGKIRKYNIVKSIYLPELAI